MSETGYSKLLIDESPLQVLPSLAVLIGLNEAIILQQIHYWLRNFQRVNDERHYKDNRYWVWNSYREWKESAFPFMSEKTIQRVCIKLENMGVLLSEKFNSSDGDHTKFYSIDYQCLDKLTKKEVEEINRAETAVDLTFGLGREVTNPRAKAALLRGTKERIVIEDRKKNGEFIVDVSDYPVDVQSIIERFCNLWKIYPPSPPKSGRGGEFALWINDARTLSKSAGEFGLDAIDAVYNDWVDASKNNGDVEVFTVARPGAIIKKTVSKVGYLRSKSNGNGSRVSEDDREAARKRVETAKERVGRSGVPN